MNDIQIYRTTNIYFIKPLLKNIDFYYPLFGEWFKYKVIRELAQHKRTIIRANYKNKTAGFIILKHTNFENKICTLKVDDCYARDGIATRLIREAIHFFQGAEFSISVSSYLVDKFDALLFKNNIYLQYYIYSRYKPGITEYYYQYKKDIVIV